MEKNEKFKGNPQDGFVKYVQWGSLCLDDMKTLHSLFKERTSPN